MRINAGIHKSRPLAAPKGGDTRPTSDRAREAIFNVLAHGIAGFSLKDARVLDVFAGTGAFGLEALSRGATFASFVENAAPALRALDENITALNEQTRTQTINTKAENLAPAADPFDIAFLDAPYDRGLSTPALERLGTQGWLKDGAILVVEVAAKEELELPKGFETIKEKTYGAARAVFLSYTKNA